jgi:hypothetical protein
MKTSRRKIGRIGTVCRVIAALGLLYLALTNGGGLVHLALPNSGLSWGLTWHEAVLGLIVLPGVMVGAGLAARRFEGRSVHLTGPLGLTINTAVIVALLANRYTAGGAELFYGITLLAAAWRGQPGCEATVLSNLILGRDDQIGCPAFSPIDALEARHSRTGGRPAGHTRHAKPERPGPSSQERQHAMTVSPQSAASRRNDVHEDQLRHNPLLHPCACLTIGALIVLAILSLHWLG